MSIDDSNGNSMGESSSTEENNSVNVHNDSVTRRSLMKIAGVTGAAGLLASQSPTVAATDDSEGFDPIEATIDDVYSAIFRGEVTAREVTETYIDRIEAYNDELNAIININPNAVDRAKELDEEFDGSGLVGPLHGIPVILKDNLNTDDMPTTAGSVLFEETIPPEDAFLTSQLRDAGAVIIAKANMGEFASGSLSSLGGQTRNPYVLDRQVAGSSSGTGSSIAANMAVLGIGTDTGGSVMHPSGFASLVGLRPTTGLLSRDGIFPLCETLDTAGPMTRTVTDAAAMMDVMVGYDPADSWTAAIRDNPPESYTDCLETDGLEGARIGVTRELFGPKTDEGEDPDFEAELVTEVIDKAIDVMDNAGAEIIDPVEIPDVEELAGEASVFSFEVKRDINRYIDQLGDEAPVDSLEEIVESDTIEGRIDLEPFLDTDVDGLDENLEYLQAQSKRQEVQQLVLTTMENEELDAFVHPMSARISPLIEEDRSYSTATNTSIAPATGFPSLTVPAGFDAEFGTPVGLQFLAGPFEEEKLFELGYAYEQITGARSPPDDFGAI